MDNRVFAKELYDFLKSNDVHGYYADAPEAEAVAGLENYLSDLHMVRETLKDIGEIADEQDDHEVYVETIKPLDKGLREIAEQLEAEERRRMIPGTGYEVKNAFRVGDKEILFAEDAKADNGMCYFVGEYATNAIIGEYSECVVFDDYLEATQVFAGRVNSQIEKTRDEFAAIGLPGEVFTAEQCHPNDYTQSIMGKVVAIKADVFRPEYRRGDNQLVYVVSGNGADANPRGNAVICRHLNTGEATRFERYEVLGEVKELPTWAGERLAAVKEQIAAEQNKSKRDKGDAR